MDDGAAGLLKGTLSFRVSSSETPGKFDPNIRLEEKWIGNEIIATGIALQVLQQSVCKSLFHQFPE